MKKNSGLILILIVVLLVGLFYSSDNTGSSGPSIGGGTTDVIVPPGGDDGSTDIIIPPGEDEPTEEEPVLLNISISNEFGCYSGEILITFEEGMTWNDFFSSEYNDLFAIDTASKNHYLIDEPSLFVVDDSLEIVSLDDIIDYFGEYYLYSDLM